MKRNILLALALLFAGSQAFGMLELSDESDKPPKELDEVVLSNLEEDIILVKKRIGDGEDVDLLEKLKKKKEAAVPFIKKLIEARKILEGPLSAKGFVDREKESLKKEGDQDFFKAVIQDTERVSDILGHLVLDLFAAEISDEAKSHIRDFTLNISGKKGGSLSSWLYPFLNDVISTSLEGKRITLDQKNKFLKNGALAISGIQEAAANIVEMTSDFSLPFSIYDYEELSNELKEEEKEEEEKEEEKEEEEKEEEKEEEEKEEEELYELI